MVEPEYFHDDDYVNENYYYYSPLADVEPPPCLHNESEMVMIDGYFSAEQTFFNCLANVLGNSMISTFFNGTYHGQLQVFTGVVMHNLVSIVEVDSTVELTFDVYMTWKDNRFKMPLFSETYSIRIY
jgi:hypothetical protein